MALFKILKGNVDNLPVTFTEGYMYITQDDGDIYVDISNSERIKLNANQATYIRKKITNEDGSISIEYFEYDDIQQIINNVSRLESAVNANSNLINDLDLKFSNEISKTLIYSIVETIDFAGMNASSSSSSSILGIAVLGEMILGTS